MKEFSQILLISDVDGTLSHQRNCISAKNKRAIRYFVEQGGCFTLATGRSQNSVRPFMEGLAVNAPCILYNGAALFDWQKQHFLHTCPLDAAAMEPYLWECSRRFPRMSIEVFSPERMYILTDPANMDAPTKQGPEFFYPVRAEEIREETWLKVLLYSAPENLQICRNLLPEFALADKTNHFFSHTYYLELVAASVSKGGMLDELMNLPLYQGKRIIAAGDFENDIAMLQRADWGVAPDNALTEVKNAANRIGVDCREGLMADIVYRILPELLRL